MTEIPFSYTSDKASFFFFLSFFISRKRRLNKSSRRREDRRRIVGWRKPPTTYREIIFVIVHPALILNFSTNEREGIYYTNLLKIILDREKILYRLTNLVPVIDWFPSLGSEKKKEEY